MVDSSTSPAEHRPRRAGVPGPAEEVDPDDVRGRARAWFDEVYGSLTDGQKWMISIIVVLIALFAGFGLRQVPKVSSFDLGDATLPGSSAAAATTTTTPTPTPTTAASAPPAPVLSAFDA